MAGASFTPKYFKFDKVEVTSQKLSPGLEELPLFGVLVNRGYAVLEFLFGGFVVAVVSEHA